MDKKKIVNYMMDRFHIMSRKGLVKKTNKKYFKMLKDNNISRRKLSKEQKKQIDDIYKKYGFSYTYNTHELAYSVTGDFRADIVPEDLFRTEVEIYLNDYDTKYVLTDKSYFDIFMPNVKFPKTIVRNIDGNFYDCKYCHITEEKAKEIIKAYNKVVYKPSIESGFGRSVALVYVQKENPLTLGKKDYVIQEVLSQHPDLANLNESSVNVIRIVTVFIDGEVEVATAALRIGGVGSFADNETTEDGKGMIIIGIDENGRLRKNGYFSCGVMTTKNPAGTEFLGYEIPKYDEILEIAKKAHTLYPRLCFIAWDFCVDKDGDIICMEYNARGPGILYYQYCNGGLLGTCADKVFEYAKKEKEKRKLF